MREVHTSNGPETPSKPTLRQFKNLAPSERFLAGTPTGTSELHKLQLGDDNNFSNGPSVQIHKFIEVQGYEAEEFPSLFGCHFLFALQLADQLQPTSDLDICGRPDRKSVV